MPQSVVVGHVLPATAQPVDALRQQLPHAVLDAGGTPRIAHRTRSRTAQTQPFVNLPEQHHPAVGGDVPAIEGRFDHAPAHAAKLHPAIRTLWHWATSLVGSVP
jgi:hypothetical protein